jgi:phosphatidylglycerol:prolipoprotein diacylglycerol transferase
MCPYLFKVGPFTVYSFGLMVGIGFIVASYLLTKELRRKGYDPNLGSTITLLAIVFGIIGSKLLYVIENWSHFAQSPLDIALSPGGLTWYGGFVLATAAIFLYSRRKKIPFLSIADAAAPGLMLGYGIARLGCHFAGDGDYGMPTDLPWATVYANGTYPPSMAFRNFPDIVATYGVNGVVPDTTPVHPTPVYELLLAIVVFIILWRLRGRYRVNGTLFSLYLVLSGLSRFFVEFIRLNERIVLGLSEAQLIGALIAIIGMIGFATSSRQRRSEKSKVGVS